jgi:curved DNA-binding protein CbpA
MSGFKDYYAILELKYGVSIEEIKSQYRRLAKTCHPDTHENDPEAEQRFKDISEAKAILSNPNKKPFYDLKWLKETEKKIMEPLDSRIEEIMKTFWPKL